MKIGLFGGSFDPVHLGHLLAARAAREEAGLDRLYFIPAAQSPFKPDALPAPAAQRVRLLNLALAGDATAEVDDQEIRRGKPSYTIDTVRAYARTHPQAEFYYLIGADQTAQIPKWRDAEELARLRREQGALLRQAAAQLKPGGRLVYSTCSLEPEENESVTREFLGEHGEFTLESQRQLLPFADGVDGAYVAALRRRA